jgi:cellulose synthase/poly-beta-1,6-N-acetylglucosamine synthase-like glycosyltransferase
MLPVIMQTLLGLYFLCAVALSFYGINCHVMVHLFNRHRRRRARQDRRVLDAFYGGALPLENPEQFAGRLPGVTTQLPVYNELNVAERLIDAAAAMIYPHGRHEIQVLDDSTDETRQRIAEKVYRLRRRGIAIRHLTRTDRNGFKAGALRCGLKQAHGEVVAIFDADFVPPPDFLMRAAPFFVQDPRIGFVQARWGHLNRDENLITRLQAVGIDGHFMIEQSARNAGDLLMNFNGTAGIFRKQAILSAGNWHDDTLTEDMDLSYRIQLAGWRCRYLADLVAPAEIPADINAFKSQQFRWAKGSIQTALKLLPQILAADFRPFVKVQAFMHLTHYMIHPMMLFLALAALPVLLNGRPSLPPAVFAVFGALLVISCTGPSRLYLAAEHALRHSWFKALWLMPVMIAFGCGLAVNNSRAVVEALIGRNSRFERTPKSGNGAGKKYRSVVPKAVVAAELLVGVWCLAATVVYFYAQVYIVGHFLLLYAAGYLAVGVLSWRCRLKYG